MIDLYDHQKLGAKFLCDRKAAGLFWSMGTGKTRTALAAAQVLFDKDRIERVMILCPAAVQYSWHEELTKVGEEYEPHTLIVSYGLLPRAAHVDRLIDYCKAARTLLILDESSFVKNRTAKTSKGAMKLSQAAEYCWLLTGTPITNSPIDLYSQGAIMEARTSCWDVTRGKRFISKRKGPMSDVSGFYHFRSLYFTMGGYKAKIPFVNKKALPDLQKRFAPYVSVVKKDDCLDLPEKSYIVREVALAEDTWKIYEQLREDALLCLPDAERKPEPNAAVRIMRLCQLTSGHVGQVFSETREDDLLVMQNQSTDVSCEKLKWLVEEIVDGELSNEDALIVWCRWTRERERLRAMLCAEKWRERTPMICQIYGGQTPEQRDWSIRSFTTGEGRKIMLAQPHAGGYGLNLTNAKCAVYLSNDFSATARAQSEDRCHRIGQKWPVTYLDVLATGPDGEKTIDHYIAQRLRDKKDLAELTCSEWRHALCP